MDITDFVLQVSMFAINNQTKVFLQFCRCQILLKCYLHLLLQNSAFSVATQYSHIVLSRKISPDIEKIRQAIEIKT